MKPPMPIHITLGVTPVKSTRAAPALPPSALPSVGLLNVTLGGEREKGEIEREKRGEGHIHVQATDQTKP